MVQNVKKQDLLFQLFLVFIQNSRRQRNNEKQINKKKNQGALIAISRNQLF